jgi:hypothetical protein
MPEYKSIGGKWVSVDTTVTSAPEPTVKIESIKVKQPKKVVKKAVKKAVKKKKAK